MYVHPAFAIDDDEALALVRGRGFGTVVVTDPAAGRPIGAHVPFLIAAGSGGQLIAEFHIARSNPFHAAIGDGCPALMIVSGDDAYLSPDWYGVDDQVPTWIYEAVHLSGRLRILAPAETEGHTDRLAAAFEERLAPKPPWTAAKMTPARHAAMLRGIVPLALDITSVAGQRKVSQHKPMEARKAAAAELAAQNDPAARRLAAYMAAGDGS